MDQQAIEKGEEEPEAEKSDGEELPNSSIKHLQRGTDQQNMEKGKEDREAKKSDDEELPKS